MVINLDRSTSDKKTKKLIKLRKLKKNNWKNQTVKKTN